MDAKDLLARFLTECLYAATKPAADPLAALAENDVSVVIADASPATLAALDKNHAGMDKALGQGKWLVLWGLNAEGLAAFNQLTGVEHKLRAFGREYVEFRPSPGNRLHVGSLQTPAR